MAPPAIIKIEIIPKPKDASEVQARKNCDATSANNTAQPASNINLPVFILFSLNPFSAQTPVTRA